MQSTEQLPAIVTPDQAADYLQVDRETVYRYIRAGKLDASRLGRSYRIPCGSIELLLLATRTRPYVTLREYTDEQIAQFMEDDVLDGAALDVARTFDRVMGASFSTTSEIEEAAITCNRGRVVAGTEETAAP